MSRFAAAAATFLVAMSVLVTVSTPALAHERRAVGPYQLVVGFVEEPSFLGGTNGVSLRVTDTRNTPPSPVEGLQETLKVEVFHGGRTRSLALDFGTVFGQPGTYAAHFVPTAPGVYIFRIHGKIAELAVEERFESGPGRFDEVRPVSALQYPEQVPVANELGQALADIRGMLDQVRILAAVAILLALAAVAIPFVRRRRA
jgi:hypothetical protein